MKEMMKGARAAGLMIGGECLLFGTDPEAKAPRSDPFLRVSNRRMQRQTIVKNRQENCLGTESPQSTGFPSPRQNPCHLTIPEFS